MLTAKRGFHVTSESLKRMKLVMQSSTVYEFYNKKVLVIICVISNLALYERLDVKIVLYLQVRAKNIINIMFLCGQYWFENGRGCDFENYHKMASHFI